MRVTIVLVACAACSQKVYSPPSRPFALSPVSALPTGKRAVDLELSRHGQIFDPPVDAGSLRLRTGIGEDTEMSIEGASLVVQDDGPSTANRNFYTGRAGVRSNPSKGPVSVFAGFGG